MIIIRLLPDRTVKRCRIRFEYRGVYDILLGFIHPLLSQQTTFTIRPNRIKLHLEPGTNVLRYSFMYVALIKMMHVETRSRA